MNVRSDNTARPELQDGIIELGVASIETKGPGGENETLGIPPDRGISNE